jgi:hypothetical protein
VTVQPRPATSSSRPASTTGSAPEKGPGPP